ncbi:MAG: ferric reductase-like transmembrane domain-containing protein [Ilumatobacteraceae bacterium]
MNPQFWWYVARASGIVAWLMLTASVLWGIVLSTKAFPRTRRPAWLLDLHRWLGALTIGFVAAHLGALVADNYVHFGLADLIVPFASSWRTGAVALGVCALWLMIAVEVTSLAMRRLPRHIWRAIHLTSYGVFWLASLHASFAGTDRTHPLYRFTTVVTVVAVMLAVIYRLAHRGTGRGRPAPVRPSAARSRPAARL